jgi:phosphoribosylglycinamide formyltransferase 1
MASIESFMNKGARLVILASGSGTNAEAIFNYFRNHPRIEIVLLVCNNPEAQVLKRTQKFGIPARVVDRNEFNDKTFMLDLLRSEKATHLVLAGFLWLIPTYLIHAFSGRIVNIHPALLPKFGGKGMYGMRVHEAVKNAGDMQTGITIHLVNEKYDEGKVLFQATCAVTNDDSPEQIATKVHRLEHESYPKVIEDWISNQG